MGLENIWKRTTRQISVSLRHWLDGRDSLLHFDGRLAFRTLSQIFSQYKYPRKKVV